MTVNPTVINGLLSLSGILFGFITATAVIKRAPKIIYIMLVINLILFYCVSKEMFEATIRQQPLLNTLTWAMSSLLSNFVTAGALLMLHVMLRARE